jgi:hypothetical protein
MTYLEIKGRREDGELFNGLQSFSFVGRKEFWGTGGVDGYTTV